MDLIEQVRRVLGEESSTRGDDAAAGIPAPRVEKHLALLLAQGNPTGTPLLSSLRQTYVTKRPTWYKTKAADQYGEATGKVRKLYHDIDSRANVTCSAIKDVAGSFISLLKTDRSILLNLSYLPSADPDFMYTHAINSSLLAMALATNAGYSEEQAMDIAVAALLLDVGMIRVPEAIRSKAGKLDKAELYEIHKHPTIGADLIAPIQDLSPISVLAIYQHHERLSGAGYPRQRTGHLIHEYSRIIAIADTYAAMVASRAYRKRIIPYQAMESIIRMGAAGLLDQGLIRKFLDSVSLFPIGSLVRLASDRIGKIIQANEKDFTKPLIAILQQEDGRPALPGTLLNLAKEDGDRIVQALDSDDIIQSPMDGF